MVIQKKFTILLSILGVTVLGNIIIWTVIFNLNAHRGSDTDIVPSTDIVTANATQNDSSKTTCSGDSCDDREKQLAAVENDLLVIFKNDQSSGNDRQVICRNGAVGIEQVAIGYVFSETLPEEELNKLKEVFGQTPFYFSRPSRDVGNSTDGFNELVYYGVEAEQVDIKNMTDFKGNAPTIEEQQFTEHYNELADLFNEVIVDENEMENLVDAVRFYVEKEHDFRVVEWPFEDLQLKDGQSTYSEDVDYVEIPIELNDEVNNLYAQIDKGLLFVTTEYGVFQTFIVPNSTHVNYSEVMEWDEAFLDFTPIEIETQNKYDLIHTNAELLQAVKGGDLETSTYYYQNPESNKIEVYQIRANKWYSSLEKLGDFCNLGSTI